jgi:NADH dehydrogenase [ubiquinone] 1 alpha subcomplex assembly factor 7
MSKFHNMSSDKGPSTPRSTKHIKSENV